MRKWTDKQQAQLDALQTLRTQAVDRLNEDIEVLLRANCYDPERAEDMCDFLRERGQAVLDMLIVHFEPSPQPCDNAAGLTPLGTIAKQE